MKNKFGKSVLLIIKLIFLTSSQVFGQKETFDIVTLSVPPGWSKSEQNDAFILSRQNDNDSTINMVRQSETSTTKQSSPITNTNTVK